MNELLQDTIDRQEEYLTLVEKTRTALTEYNKAWMRLQASNTPKMFIHETVQ